MYIFLKKLIAKCDPFSIFVKTGFAKHESREVINHLILSTRSYTAKRSRKEAKKKIKRYLYTRCLTKCLDDFNSRFLSTINILRFSVIKLTSVTLTIRDRLMLLLLGETLQTVKFILIENPRALSKFRFVCSVCSYGSNKDKNYCATLRADQTKLQIKISSSKTKLSTRSHSFINPPIFLPPRKFQSSLSRTRKTRSLARAKRCSHVFALASAEIVIGSKGGGEKIRSSRGDTFRHHKRVIDCAREEREREAGGTLLRRR